jgi:hypothetical protein
MTGLELFGRRHIGEDHKFFDQPMTVEAQCRNDRNRSPISVENNPVFAQVEFQRPPRRARPRQCCECTVKRLDRCGRYRFRRLALPVSDCLDLLVS